MGKLFADHRAFRDSGSSRNFADISGGSNDTQSLPQAPARSDLLPGSIHAANSTPIPIKAVDTLLDDFHGAYLQAQAPQRSNRSPSESRPLNYQQRQQLKTTRVLHM